MARAAERTMRVLRRAELGVARKRSRERLTNSPSRTREGRFRRPEPVVRITTAKNVNARRTRRSLDAPFLALVRQEEFGDSLIFFAMARDAVTISFRLGGDDGVAVEARKWSNTLETLGFTTRRVAGAIEDEGRRGDVIIPGLAIDAAEVVDERA